MKKLILVLLSVFFLAGCGAREKTLYLPEVQNDKTFATVGGEKTKDNVYQGEGYTISIPDGYRYERDLDDGNLEETWNSKKYDDVEISVTTYKNTDEIVARGIFLRENDDYIIEDLTGNRILGIEPDGDSLWFSVYEKDGNTYIVSWEYPKNTNEAIRKELAEIAATFRFS